MSCRKQNPAASSVQGKISGSKFLDIQTSAAKFVAEVSSWGRPAGFIPKSREGLCLVTYYNYMYVSFGDDGSHRARLAIAVSAPDVVEIHDIVSFPVKHGIGTQLMNKLCVLADELGVTLWLDAHPFGTVGLMLKEPNLSLAKLLKWYKQLGFFQVSAPNRKWLNEFHRQYYPEFAHPMMRNPSFRRDVADSISDLRGDRQTRLGKPLMH